MPELEAELDLPWVRLQGEAKDGPPRLNRQNLFLIACREAFRDGELSDRDKGFLSDFCQTLQIPPDSARGFARLAKQEADSGKIRGVGDLDAKIVFKRACALAEAKGEVDPEERKLLGNLAGALGVPMMRANSTIRQMAIRIEEIKPEPQQKISLVKDRNIDGTEVEAKEEDWGDGDPLTQSGIMRLGVDIPRPPPRRKPGAPKSGAKKAAPAAPSAGVAERTPGLLGLGIGLLATFGGLAGLRYSWFQADKPSVAVMAFSGMAFLFGLVLSPWGAYRSVRPN